MRETQSFGDIERRRDVRALKARTLALLGMLVALMTAIALMVPAISMTHGDLVCGMEEHTHSDACYEMVLDCDQDGVEGHEHTDDCYKRELTCELDEHTHIDSCYAAAEEEPEESDDAAEAEAATAVEEPATEQVTPEQPETENETAVPEEQPVEQPEPPTEAEAEAVEAAPDFPAQTLTATIEDADGNIIFIAEADAPEGALPTDTTMTLEPIEPENAKPNVEAAISDNAKLAGAVEIAQTIPVKLAFADVEGFMVEPAKAITVRLTAAEVRDMDKPRLVHAPATGTPAFVKKVSLVNRDETDTTKDTEDTLKFKAEEAGEYTIVELRAIEEEKPEEASDSTEPQPEPEPEPEPSGQSFTGTLADEAGNVTLTVDVIAPAGALPEGATMKVAPVEQQAVLDAAIEQAASETAIKQDRAKALAADIAFYDADGNEIEPQAEVHVSMHAPEIASQGELAVVHVDDANNAQVVETTNTNTDAATAEFDSAEFSVYALVYTVDFHWEVDGKTYQFSIPGGGFASFSNLVQTLGVVADDPDTEADEVQSLLDDIESIEFSNPKLLSVSKVDTNTTVGALKDALGLKCAYSADLTDSQIASINAQAVAAGDWALISLKPFNTEESLTVSMTNGERFTIRVTDAQPVTDTAAFKTGNRFVIAYVDDQGKYNVLKSDGSYEQFATPEDIDFLDSQYLWQFYYVFTERDQTAPNANFEYYFIRPTEDLSKSIALIDVHDEALVQTGANNIAVIPQGDGTYIMEGYSSVGAPMPYLYFNGTRFIADGDHQTPLTIFTQDDIKKYQFTVRTANPDMGLVYGKDKDGVEQNGVVQFVTRTKDSGNNNWGAQAKASDESAGGQYRYFFDYFDLNGKVIPAEKVQITNNGRNAKIGADQLEIPYNGSILTAHFKQNPNYVGASKVESLEDWIDEIKNTNVPLDEDVTKKTAEVYDYENRIYRVDLATRSSLSSFSGTVDLGLILDVSGSMDFPSKLVEAKNAGGQVIGTKNIRAINESTGFFRYAWQDWGLDTSEEYYVIAEKSTRATVFRVFYEDHGWSNDTGWYRVDASFGNNEYNGNTRRAQRIDGSTAFGLDTSFDYPIYVSGDDDSNGTAITRSYYEKQSIDKTASTLNEVLGILNIAADSSQAPNVRAAWNTFCATVTSHSPDNAAGKHSFVSLKDSSTLNIDYATSGGTRTDSAVADAQSFDWGGSNTKYAILITDGAPQYGSGQHPSDLHNDLALETERLIDETKDRIAELKAQGVKVITVGLSMKDVEKGNQLLYDIADTVNGKRMFFQAESGDELENVMLEIVKTILLPCNVYGDVTDTVGEAFYLVDRETGKPLQPGDTISLSGDVTSDLSQPYGVVQPDGRTVKWTDHAFTPEGWHGSVYVKAKEDLLGGNTLPTNSGDAVFNAKEYSTSTNPDQRILITTNTQQIVNPDKFHPVQNLETPLVNVNELNMSHSNTEWTVYLGTEVDPKEQMEKLWHEILVEEVVKEGAADDKDGDGLPETGKNQSGNLWYPKAENSIDDDRESQGSGAKQTFALNDLLKVLAEGKGYSWWDYGKSEPNWDEFFAQALNGGITIPYDVYGIDDGSNIVITLTKNVAQGEEDGIEGQSPHAATVTGDGVEQYTLKAVFSPDYTVLPRGQGGSHTGDIHTGTYGTLYQGHAAGTETSENTHVINVYAEPLDVLKKDNHDAALPGAVFKLYRAAKTGEAGVPLSSYDASLTGSYYCISTATSGSDGLVHLAPHDTTTPTHTIPVAKGLTAQNLLVPLEAGQTYYLVEESAPDGYRKDDTVRVVTVEAGPDLYTQLDKETPVASSQIDATTHRPTVAYNWNEGVAIHVKELGSDANEERIVNHETGAVLNLGRPYMLRSDSENLAITQVVVLNDVVTDIQIQKTDTEGEGLAGAIFELKEVNGHEESYVTGVGGLSSFTKTIDGKELSFTSAFETTGQPQTFTGLPDGTYRLYEAYVPAGYISTFRYIQFTIENHVMKGVESDSGDSSASFTAATGNSLALLSIENKPGEPLPNTGGPGTTPVYLFGILLVGLAGAILVAQYRKQRRDGSR